MLDAATGQLLWAAGDQPDADRVLSYMTHGFAARVAALDTSGDGYADRLYAADIGGRLWRFDVWNGRAPTELVTGGVLASLGAADPTPAAVGLSDARRFFSAPDVALIQPRGGDAYYNLAIGSGDGDNVHTAGIRDRFYSIRDREPFVKRTQAAYDAAQVIFDADVTNISASPQSAQVPGDSPGWKLDLSVNGQEGDTGAGAMGSGEKVLAESLTANGVILFTTYQPANEGLDPAGCPPQGTNRVYAVRVESGAAAFDLNDDLEVTADDRFEALAQEGIAGEPRIEWVRPGSPSAPGLPTDPISPATASAATPRCLVGAELMSACVRFDSVLRTFWKRSAVN
jgi:type IV pilus assembly protein PilY1